MQLIAPSDSMFLLGESREHPMHVGGLQTVQAAGGCRAGVRA
jgi:diacylglycerol O-acyltransferase